MYLELLLDLDVYDKFDYIKDTFSVDLIIQYIEKFNPVESVDDYYRETVGVGDLDGYLFDAVDEVVLRTAFDELLRDFYM